MRGLVVMVLVGAVACGEDLGGGGGNGQTVTLGANLNNAPNSLVTCADGYPIQINPSFPQPFNEQGNASCALLNFLPPQGPSLGSGVAQRGRIRVGPTTGPMRFIRMRLLAAQGFGTQCCSLEEYGNQFTPAANQVTEVPLNFRITVETDPDSGIITNDVIGLEVLAPNVPIPGFWTNNGGADITVADYIYLPSFTQRGQQAPSNRLLENVGYSGFVMTTNIDFTPDN